MTKRNKIIYWVATIWLAAAMLASGVQQLLQMKSFADIILPLGYPLYFLSILGVWKILGVLAILLPGYKLIKEWAYAGFFFAMSGGIVSYLATGSPVKDMIPCIILLIMTVLSWYFRPANRKIILSTVNSSYES